MSSESGLVYRKTACVHERIERAVKRPAVQAERTSDRGGLGGGGWPRFLASGSLRGMSIRKVVGRTSATAIAGNACNGFRAQIAINGHLSQSTGDLSGQHGMSSGIDDICIDDICIESIEVDAPAFAAATSGATMRPAITRIASSRRMRSEAVTDGKLAYAGENGKLPDHHEFASFVRSRCHLPSLINLRNLAISCGTKVSR